MLRFSWNRWWTLILALSLCLACIASRSTPVRAQSPGEITDSGMPGPYSGDPDLPTGPAKTKSGRGALQPGGRLATVRSGGEGRVTARVVMWRLLVMVKGLRGYYFHF
jgi:hypothetical protein